MNKPKKSVQRLLADRFRMEAARSRPVFSESLHRTIAEAVARQQSDNAAVVRSAPAVEKRRMSWASRRVWTVATAAACMLAVAIVVGKRDGGYPGRSVESPQTTVAKLTLADVPPPDVWTEYAWSGVQQLAVSASPMPSSDPLRLNAQLAAGAVLRRLPIDADWNDSESP
jgi:negative regulator of sigma E activity